MRKTILLIMINGMIGLHSQNASTTPVRDVNFGIKTLTIDWTYWPYLKEAKQHTNGSIYLYSNDYSSIGVVKLSSDGNKLWDKHYIPEWVMNGFFIDNEGNSYTGYFNSLWDDKVYIKKYNSEGLATDIVIPIEGATYVNPLGITGIKRLNRLYIPVFYMKETYEPEYQYIYGVVVKYYDTVTNEVVTLKDYTPATDFFEVDDIWSNDWGVIKGSEDGNIYYARYMNVGDVTKLKVERFDSEFTNRTLVGEKNVVWSECMRVEEIETSSNIVAVTVICPDETFMFNTLNKEIISINSGSDISELDKEGDLYILEHHEFITKYSRKDGSMKWRFTEGFDNWAFTDVLMIDDNDRIYTIGELENAVNDEWFYITRYIQPQETNYIITKSTGDEQIVVVSSYTEPLVSLVTDLSSRPVSGIDIDFVISTYPEGSRGYELTKTRDKTDEGGRASTQLKLGDIPREYGVTAVCNECIPSSVTFTCCGKLPNDDFKQYDNNWKLEHYDNICSTEPPGTGRYRPVYSCDDPIFKQVEYQNKKYPFTIWGKGCALTALATLVNYYGKYTMEPNSPYEFELTNPSKLNLYLKNNTGYSTEKDTIGDVIFDRVKDYTGYYLDYIGGMDVCEDNINCKKIITIDDLIGLINRDLYKGRPIIIKVSGHFMVIIGKCGSKYIVSDPQGKFELYDPLGPKKLIGIRRFKLGGEEE